MVRNGSSQSLQIQQRGVFNNSSDSYVTKEATGAISQREDNTCSVTCNIEQPNCVEDKPEDVGNVVHDGKKTMGKLDSVINFDSPKCCCDCHSNVSKTCNSMKKFDNDSVNGK